MFKAPEMKEIIHLDKMITGIRTSLKGDTLTDEEIKNLKVPFIFLSEDDERLFKNLWHDYDSFQSILSFSMASKS